MANECLVGGKRIKVSVDHLNRKKRISWKRKLISAFKHKITHMLSIFFSEKIFLIDSYECIWKLKIGRFHLNSTNSYKN